MEILQTLGVALGLASLAGLNLYLTVFVTGLSIQQHWIDVSQTHPDLAILGHPAIIAISGVLFCLQFFADKVPWVDSLWDAVHTVIRPVGGAFLAIRVLGNPDPVFDVIAALLAGSATILTHSLKAGTRLVANTSPEPFSNIALSVTEDVTVLGGLALIKYDPTLAFVLFLLLSITIAYFGPKLFRALKVHAFLLWTEDFLPRQRISGRPNFPKSFRTNSTSPSRPSIGTETRRSGPCLASARRRAEFPAIFSVAWWPRRSPRRK